LVAIYDKGHAGGYVKMTLLALISLTGVLIAWLAFFGCVPPASFRRVEQPRRGEALGGRVAVVYSENYQVNLGGLEKLHTFDIRKYAKIYLKLVTDGLIKPEDVFVPEQASREQILLVHTAEFLENVKDPGIVARYLEASYVAVMPAGVVEEGILKPMRYATGGTILAGREALRHGVGINIGGGFHHAKPHAGGGFNVYADIAIAIRALQKEGLIRRALVVDLDVHQGNGTAVIFAGDDDVFTFSMHQRDIYPVPKAASDLDVELARGTGDEAYLKLLGEHLPRVLEQARADIVFIQAGCDTLAGDPLAGLAMTEDGIVRRDAMVIDECVRRGIPVAMALGGGYSSEAWQVQYASIRRTIMTHGQAGPRQPPRSATVKEKFYTK
jgi:histone deacetylase 11